MNCFIIICILFIFFLKNGAPLGMDMAESNDKSKMGNNIEDDGEESEEDEIIEDPKKYKPILAKCCKNALNNEVKI
jgi:hypothetical protein